MTTMLAALRAGLLGPEIPIDNPVTMLLTPQEIEKAIAIKAAVQADEGLTDLADYEYVQHALTHGNASESNSMAVLLCHIGCMQAFRETYKIQDTVEEGVACIQAVMEQQPGLLMSLHYTPNIGNCTVVEDWGAFLPSRINTDDQVACFLRGLYYCFQALNPTFLATRLGKSNLVECEGVTWNNFDVNFHERVLAELLLSFPTRYCEMYLVNSPLVANVAYGLWKKHMSQNLKDSFRLGYQIPGMEGRRIDDLFKIPTPELAAQSTLATSKSLLRVRYRHQAVFILPRIATGS